MTEREIDTAIDRTVRDLMEVDTDSAFRARVTARLQRPARRMLLRPVAAVALTAVAVSVAIVWMRPSSTGLPPATAVAVPSAPTSPTPPLAAGAGTDRGVALPGAAGRTERPPRRAAAGPIPRGTVVAALAEAPASMIPPLTALDPISVEPIAQASIVPSEIVVAPLSPISELEIAPLEPRTARN